MPLNSELKKYEEKKSCLKLFSYIDLLMRSKVSHDNSAARATKTSSLHFLLHVRKITRFTWKLGDIIR